MSLHNSAIRGQVHFVLSVNDGNILRMGDCMEKLVAKRLVVTHIKPSPQALAYRRHLYRLCLTSGTNLCEKRVAMSTLPNHDLRIPDVVTVFIPAGVAHDMSDLKKVVGSSCRRVLLPSNLTEYPNSRWIGADDAWDEFCFGEGCHQLFSASYGLMLQELEAFRSRSQDPKGVGGVLAAADDAMVANMQAAGPSSHG